MTRFEHALSDLSLVHRTAVARWQYPLAPSAPVVLLYHGVSALDSVLDMHASTFAKQMEFLARHYRVIDWRDAGSRRGLARPSVVLTFDDGFRNNIDVAAPILSRLGLPAIFFVCTRHSESGRALWFRHLELIEHFFPGNRLSFDGRVFDLSPHARRRSMAALRNLLLSLRPHPQALYEALELLPSPDSLVTSSHQADRYEGLRQTDIEQLAAETLFTIGIHTEDHPMLPYCEPAEGRRQLLDNQALLQRASRDTCDIAAYPSGEYNVDTIDVARAMKLRAAFAVDVRVGRSHQYEIPRFGIYRSSLRDLATKVRWGAIVRYLGKNIG